jgi:hypothetical protein
VDKLSVLCRNFIFWRPALVRGTSVTTAKHCTAMQVAGPVLLNQFSSDCIHDGFQAVVGAQFLVDVVQVVSQGLQADVE